VHLVGRSGRPLGEPSVLMSATVHWGSINRANAPVPLPGKLQELALVN
jgi:hypothetical protein